MQWDKEGDALRFLESYHIPYPVGRDASGSVSRSYGLSGTPTTYLIDRGGRVAAGRVGALEPAELDRLVESILAKS